MKILCQPGTQVGTILAFSTIVVEFLINITFKNQDKPAKIKIIPLRKLSVRQQKPKIETH